MAMKDIRIPKEHQVDFSSATVDVLVGSDPATPFTVHQSAISASSQFFKTALKTEWRKGEDNPITLEEDDADTFSLYLNWVYSRTVPVATDDIGEYLRLAKAYVLADRLQDGDYQNVTIDAMVHKSKVETPHGSPWFPGEKVISYIYKHTLELSNGRRLIADLFVSRGDADGLLGWLEPDEMPKDFLFDIAYRSFNGACKDPTAAVSLCDYHHHEPDRPTCHKACPISQPIQATAAPKAASSVIHMWDSSDSDAS